MFKRLASFVRDRVSFLNYSKRDGRGGLPIEGRIAIALTDATSLRLSWNLWSNFHHIVPIVVDASEGKITTSIGFAPVAFWFSVENYRWAKAISSERSTSYGTISDPREVRIDFHDKTIWWSFWMNPNESKSNESPYRRGSFDVADFVFGEAKFSKEIVRGPVRIVIPMIEGSYPAQYTIETRTWKRPRWFTKTSTSATVTMDPRVDKSFRPIPVPGKGESGWDLDEDAIYSTGVDADARTSPPKIVAQVVQRVLELRHRRGGMNWKPEIVRASVGAPN